jgi:rhodanese-related sulfurtransferase
MKIKFIYIIAVFSVVQFSSAQQSLSNLLKKHNTKHIPYISAETLSNEIDQSILLDAREFSEYNVSHIKNAIYVGFNYFQLDTIQKQIPNKNQKIVVYCSLGVRSETIADKLKKAGFKNVYNLYGGVFEWKNHDFPIYNSEEKKTENIHAFSKEWGKWLKKGVKIYD